MYSDPRGVKRSVKDRLGTSFVRSSAASVLDRQIFLKRQHQDILKWSISVGERNHASQLQNDVQKRYKYSNSKTKEAQKVAPKNDQTQKVTFATESNGTSAAQLMLTKKPPVQSAPTPTSGEKKHTVSRQLTVATFLQKLGLSKYLITFQAEEVDMFALKHMNDADLKSIGLPMGPRKKILFAFASAKSKKSSGTKY